MGPEAHPASCAISTGSFPWVRCGRGVTLIPHPLLVPRSKIKYSCTSTLPKVLRGLWKGETYLYTGDEINFQVVSDVACFLCYRVCCIENTSVSVNIKNLVIFLYPSLCAVIFLTVYLIHSNVDLELKHVLRCNVLVCIRMHEQDQTWLRSCCLLG